MESSVNERLNAIVDAFENGKKAAFARKVGISPQGAQELLAGRKGDPSFKVLVKILESYPQVQMEWLILGRGEMVNRRLLLFDSLDRQIHPSNASPDGIVIAGLIEVLANALPHIRSELEKVMSLKTSKIEGRAKGKGLNSDKTAIDS